MASRTCGANCMPWQARQPGSVAMPRIMRNATPSGRPSRITDTCPAAGAPARTACWKASSVASCQPSATCPALRLRPGSATRPRRTPCSAITASAMAGASAWQTPTATVGPPVCIAACRRPRRRPLKAWAAAFARSRSGSADDRGGVALAACPLAATRPPSPAADVQAVAAPARHAAHSSRRRFGALMRLPACARDVSARSTAAESPPASAPWIPGCRRSARSPGH